MRNRKIVTRLSSLFFIQLLLVVAFVLFGSFVINSVNLNEPWTTENVKFIKGLTAAPQYKPKLEQQYTTPTFFKIIKNDDFNNHFITVHEEMAISSDISESLKIKKICFKDGILEPNINVRASRKVNNKTDSNIDTVACVCRSEWHGSACSEPEIIWRAFMASRQQMIRPHMPTMTKNPHNVFYIIEGVTSINLETLEIQILELYDIVNLFVLCDLFKMDEPSLALRHRMNKGFLKDYEDRILLVRDATCSSTNVYRRMKKIVGSQIHPLDILIHSRNDEILNRKAIHYLKWHNHWHQPLQFRLRWNIFGFFYQHPDKTIISANAFQINVLEQIYGSDLEKIRSKHLSLTALTVGDLNHLGGWFCQYCQQPLDIIQKFHLDSKLVPNDSSDPLKDTYHRKPVINVDYIQKLIQYGLYIDGKVELQKLRHSNYYTPESVARNRWKFDNIVTNFYSNWNDDIEGDY